MSDGISMRDKLKGDSYNHCFISQSLSYYLCYMTPNDLYRVSTSGNVSASSGGE